MGWGGAEARKATVLGSSPGKSLSKAVEPLLWRLQTTQVELPYGGGACLLNLGMVLGPTFITSPGGARQPGGKGVTLEPEAW